MVFRKTGLNKEEYKEYRKKLFNRMEKKVLC